MCILLIALQIQLIKYKYIIKNIYLLSIVKHREDIARFDDI